jgi:membrane fusion protein (multidrug efflux system)
MSTCKSYIAGVLLVFLVVIGCEQKQGDTKNKDASSAPRTVLVDARPVETRTVNETIDVVGSLEADERTVVTTEVAGKVEKIHFDEGSVIKEGINGNGSLPVLVELDDDLLRAERRTVEAELQASQSDLEQAKDDFQRQERLKENGATTEAEFTRAKIQLKQAKANVEEVKARLEETREQLEKTRIRAPFAGVLGEREVSRGSYVRPGDPIVEIVRQDPIEVSFDVPEKFRSELNTGQTVQLDVGAYPERAYEGTVFYISPSAQPDTRTIEVKARLENPERALNPGMFANVRLITATRENAPVVPDSAVVPRDDRHFVYVVNDGTAKRVEVQLGQRYPDAVEIRKGLDGSETVITAGLQKVNEGVNVNVR